jgi:outer membrane lipoprotein SlyB
MINRLLKLATSAAALGLTACVTVPVGPSTAALPGSRKSFEEFQADDARCRQYASAQIGGPSAIDNANQSAVASAIVGTAIGAAAGAAIGGNSAGAGVGAGVGLLAGTAAGAGAAQTSYYATQRRYDTAYTQCMYAAGNKVALTGHFAREYRRQQAAPAYPPPNAPPPRDYAPPDYHPPGSTPPPNAPPPR